MTENEELRADEPSASYHSVKVSGISQGRQSKVDILEFPAVGGERSLVVWKRMGVGKGLTETEAEELHMRLRTYRRSLRNAGWNVPKLFQTRLLASGSEHQVVSFESYVQGGDGEHLVEDPAQPNYRKWHLLRSALETLAEYPGELERGMVAGRKVTLLPHGLDLKLANLVMDPDNILYFVDLFGPKELDGENWVTYNPKLESIDEEALRAVCATREGAILRLYRLAEATWKKSGSIDIAELRESLPSLLEQSGIVDYEVDFIMSEVEQGYPWLDELYTEHAV